MKRFCMVLSCALALAATSSVASATTVFSSSLDDLTGLTILGTADTASTSGYDYSADGIPEAPNSVAGAATTGLKLEANNGDGTAGAEEIVAVTNGLALSGVYTVQADLWINSVGPFPGGGAGSTEFGGIGVGHDATTVGRNGGALIYSGEGGSSRDYRLYKNTLEQFTASGQYAVASNNGSDVVISAAFPGLEAPASQGQTGTTGDGSGGFQWMTLLAEVDSGAGTATFSLTSADSGNTVEIGTIDSNVGDAVSLTGEAAFVFADLFSSVTGDPNFTFGVFDNVVVTVIPEPTSIALLSLAGLAMLSRRR